mgnify:CR=1 FL=1
MTAFWMNMMWVAAAALLGFVVSALFAGKLRLPRSAFLLAYVPLAGGLVVWFGVCSRLDVLGTFASGWIWGTVGAVIVGTIAVRNVLRQEGSPRRKGAGVMLDIVWPGALYGLVDALLLSVLPVIAVRQALAPFTWTSGWIGQAGVGASALIASVVVTVAYHVGYPEFRNSQVWWTVLGNGLMTIAYLATGNPLAAILPHIAMHIAAMLHGRETTLQLPPHYATSSRAA